jgi:hypothetical protein
VTQLHHKKVYGSTDPVIAYTVSPSLVGSDSFTGALTRVAGEKYRTYGINQGFEWDLIIPLVMRVLILLLLQTNYRNNYITNESLWNNRSFFAYTLSPSLGSDAFTGTLTRTAGENIGNYAITQGNLSAGSNYDISYVSKDFIQPNLLLLRQMLHKPKYGTANPVYSYTVSPSLVSGNSSRDSNEPWEKILETMLSHKVA